MANFDLFHLQHPADDKRDAGAGAWQEAVHAFSRKPSVYAWQALMKKPAFAQYYWSRRLADMCIASRAVSRAIVPATVSHRHYTFTEPFVFPRAQKRARNRVVLAAMTNTQSHVDGTLGDDEHRWLLSRARGGFGIVTTCASHVSRDGQGWVGQLGIFDDFHLPGLKRLAGDLRREGALSLVQIFHAGVRAPSKVTGHRPWSASEFVLDKPGFEKPRAATQADIEGVIEAFARAAERAAKAGFDGVELHGAHGYLLTQFLGTKSNLRSDAWGGSLENRARLLLETLKAVRARVPDSFLVGVRMSLELPEQGIVMDESLKVARWLADQGADFLHVSHWDSFKRPLAYPDSQKPLTTWFREAVGTSVPVLATGSIATAEQGQAVIDQGADLIGLGRTAISNPSWPKDAVEPGFEPVRLPLTPDELRKRSIGEAFIRYLRGMHKLVQQPEI